MLQRSGLQPPPAPSSLPHLWAVAWNPWLLLSEVPLYVSCSRPAALQLKTVLWHRWVLERPGQTQTTNEPKFSPRIHSNANIIILED